MEQEKRHNVEEFHRDEWQPLMVRVAGQEDKVQKHVMITEEQAETMNLYKQERAIRYVLSEEKPKKEKTKLTDEEKDEKAELQKQYKEKFDKKPFPAWDIATLKEKLNN
jgi:hypothetical protein